MLYTDILRQANLHAGLTIDPTVGRWYLNEGLNVLAIDYDTACKRSSATVTAEARTWTDLPDGTLRVTECRVNNAEYGFYEASLGQIRFEEAVTAELAVLTAPSRLDSDGEPDINALYHLPLALYMAARARQTMFADEEQDAARLMSEFITEVFKVNNRLNRLKGTRRILKVGAFR